jgi:hypothetical protein
LAQGWVPDKAPLIAREEKDSLIPEGFCFRLIGRKADVFALELLDQRAGADDDGRRYRCCDGNHRLQALRQLKNVRRFPFCSALAFSMLCSCRTARQSISFVLKLWCYRRRFPTLTVTSSPPVRTPCSTQSTLLWQSCDRYAKAVFCTRGWNGTQGEQIVVGPEANPAVSQNVQEDSGSREVQQRKLSLEMPNRSENVPEMAPRHTWIACFVYPSILCCCCLGSNALNIQVRSSHFDNAYGVWYVLTALNERHVFVSGFCT